MLSGARSRTAALLLLLAATAYAGQVFAEPSCDFSRLRQAAARSLVLVEGKLALRDTPLQETRRGFDTCLNTGFFVSRSGHVLTSLTGLAGCEEINVHHPDGRIVPAKLAAVDQAADLALLSTHLKDTPALPLAETAPDPGELLALAAARIRDSTPDAAIRPGLISSCDASIRLHGVKWQRLIEIPICAPEGAASGPLLNTSGELAGIILAVRSGETSGGRIGSDLVYGIPADQLAPILRRLKSGESHRLGWLGVSVAREPDKEEGVRVESVLRESPAQAAGIRPGDVLLEIAGQPLALEAPDTLARYVAQGVPGEDVPLKLLRGDQIKTISARIAPRPFLICHGSQRASGPISLLGRLSMERRFRDLQMENERLRNELAGLERLKSGRE